MANIPPPDNPDEGFAFTYTPDNPVIDIRELRYLIVKEILGNHGIRKDIGISTIESSLNHFIIPAAIRLEEYINSGK